MKRTRTCVTSKLLARLSRTSDNELKIDESAKRERWTDGGGALIGRLVSKPYKYFTSLFVFLKNIVNRNSERNSYLELR